ncbi:DinB family protein [Actinoplanes sp. NPDC023714]|uniref:DinB family protein n=1 Tax=Actinoplanes sp. NPDC023714 TaxID=3154322 RepID=UPI0033FB49FB
MSIEFPAPTVPAADRADVFLDYLGYFRETVIAKVAALPEADRRTSRLPSGWTPLELVKHLRHMERRWIEWGFQGAPIPDPWADRENARLDARWHVDPTETAESLIAGLRAQARHTDEVVRTTDLATVGRPGPRWDGAPPATLERILFHMFQEYARHAGHLDIVAELAGGATGE